MNMNMKTLIAAATLCVAGGANAALLSGETLNYQYFFPDLSSPYSNAQNGDFVVGPGVEITNVVDGAGTLDASDTQITVLFAGDISFSAGTFNGFRLTDALGTIASFASVTINPLTTLGSGFGASNVSFDADHIWVNWASLGFAAGQQLVLDVSAVPEPETYALMLAGLGCLAFVARRRKV